MARGQERLLRFQGCVAGSVAGGRWIDSMRKRAKRAINTLHRTPFGALRLLRAGSKTQRAGRPDSPRQARDRLCTAQRTLVQDRREVDKSPAGVCSKALSRYLITMQLRGCGTALVTPFRQDGSIDDAAFRNLVAWQVEIRHRFSCALRNDRRNTHTKSRRMAAGHRYHDRSRCWTRAHRGGRYLELHPGCRRKSSGGCGAAGS